MKMSWRKCCDSWTLCESGAVNMFGAAPYLQEAFRELDEAQARQALVHWMNTFSERKD